MKRKKTKENATFQLLNCATEFQQKTKNETHKLNSI